MDICRSSYAENYESNRKVEKIAFQKIYPSIFLETSISNFALHISSIFQCLKTSLPISYLQQPSKNRPKGTLWSQVSSHHFMFNWLAHLVHLKGQTTPSQKSEGILRNVSQGQEGVCKMRSAFLLRHYSMSLQHLFSALGDLTNIWYYTSVRKTGSGVLLGRSELPSHIMNFGYNQRTANGQLLNVVFCFSVKGWVLNVIRLHPYFWIPSVGGLDLGFFDKRAEISDTGLRRKHLNTIKTGEAILIWTIRWRKEFNVFPLMQSSSWLSYYMLGVGGSCHWYTMGKSLPELGLHGAAN